MCNCGNKRKAYTSSAVQQGTETLSPTPVQTKAEVIFFEYTGKSGLTVTGTITGKKYRFAFPGDQQGIDYRDAGGMMAVPVLKKLNVE